MKNRDHLKQKIREILDFPTTGVNFKDITPLLEDGRSFREAIDAMTEFFNRSTVDKVVGIDARGFLFASAIAYNLNAGMVIVRKKGKLPYETIIREHELEYGKGTLEMHKDAVLKNERIVVIDDVLATGGTAEAAVNLVEHLGGNVVGIGVLVELSSFGGRERLKKYNVKSVIVY
ncbi:MAG: adenine phosphoribosyltransferase [Parcubacteria group bacterium RIFCSPLOWO2_01_FULL_48_18]|nr:MAG: adenine phosphoribosyltransferase [Parcubacteria group bacterium RIFCSPLOWO2_01_FULL_48_18]